jgi:hypothetical protein
MAKQGGKAVTTAQKTSSAAGFCLVCVPELRQPENGQAERGRPAVCLVAVRRRVSWLKMEATRIPKLKPKLAQARDLQKEGNVGRFEESRVVVGLGGRAQTGQRRDLRWDQKRRCGAGQPVGRSSNKSWSRGSGVSDKRPFVEREGQKSQTAGSVLQVGDVVSRLHSGCRLLRRFWRSPFGTQ